MSNPSKGLLTKNIDGVLWRHIIPICALSFLMYLPGILLKALAFFALTNCWPLMWRWNNSYYVTSGFPVVFNASCAQSSFWPLLEHPVSHPITGITLALIAFYSSKRLNRWLVSKSLKAHAAATAGEEEGSTD